jgi:hypothetical protein
MDYPHLQLAEWPFNIVPSERTATFLTSRDEMSNEIDRLVRTMRLRPASSMHLLWAWYGAGKTHTLYYLAHQIRQNSVAQPALIEFNRGTSIVAVCRALLAQIPHDVLELAFLESYTGSKLGAELQSDVERAIYALLTGTADAQAIARRYLRTEPLTRQECREIGVATHIRGVQECVETVSALNRLLHSGVKRRLLLILDEFQRVAEIPRAQRSEILSALHAIFNACPENLTLILSFSGEPEERMPAWLTRELADRIGLERVLLLPPLGKNEALNLLKGVMRHYRPSGYAGDDRFPFGDGALEEIVSWVSTNAEMKPRALIQAASVVLEEMEPQIESGAIPSISATHVSKSLHARKGALSLTADDNG